MNDSGSDDDGVQLYDALSRRLQQKRTMFGAEPRFLPLLRLFPVRRLTVRRVWQWIWAPTRTRRTRRTRCASQQRSGRSRACLRPRRDSRRRPRSLRSWRRRAVVRVTHSNGSGDKRRPKVLTGVVLVAAVAESPMKDAFEALLTPEEREAERLRKEQLELEISRQLAEDSVIAQTRQIMRFAN